MVYRPNSSCSSATQLVFLCSDFSFLYSCRFEDSRAVIRKKLKTNCVALDLSLRKKFSKIYLIVIHGCRDEQKYTHFSVLYGIAYVVIAKPQFLSDSEALIAFHSSACVLLYRAKLANILSYSTYSSYLLNETFRMIVVILLCTL